MNQAKASKSKILLAASLTIGICLAGPIGPPDSNCNPAVDPPSSGGCTWYNFYALEDGSITAGSSFQNYYVPASDPPWTFTLLSNAFFRVVDGGHQGDVFSIFDNASLLGSTSPTPIDELHACAGDPTGTNPAACWNDPLMSRGEFLLGPGNHSITVSWDQRVPGGPSTLQWFNLSSNEVPEPGSLVLVSSGIALAALLRRRKR